MKESLETMRVLKFKMRRTSSDPHSFFVDPDAFSRNPEKLLHEIIDFSPDIIVCYTSALVEFCSTLKTNGLSGLLSIRFAVSSGEVLTETQRTLAHEVLGCEVYNRYGLEEFYRTVGVECQEHHGFHLNAESFLLEVVDERGNSLSNGSSGRIIITDLYNRAMPFIRYDTGDIGTILPDPCPCGVETERFTIEGRLAHLRLGDESINYVDINRVVTLRAGAILQWQVHKLEEKRLAFFLVQGPAFNDRIATELMDVLRKLLPTTDVEISYVDAITQDSGKKVRLFVDHTA